MMDRGKNYYRIGAQLEVGRRFALPILLAPVIVRLIKLGAGAAVVGALALGALWLWLDVSHEILAGAAWLVWLLLTAIAIMTNRSRCTHVLLSLAGALFFCASVYTAIKG